MFSYSIGGLNQSLRLNVTRRLHRNVDPTCTETSAPQFQDLTPVSAEYDVPTYVFDRLTRRSVFVMRFGTVARGKTHLDQIKPILKSMQASKRWKLFVYDAIVRSFGHSQILHAAPMFINRERTNNKVLEETSATAYPSRVSMW